MKTVKKLSALEIDEVSLVDRPANQHGTVAFTKRAEDEVTYYDAEGTPVAEDDVNVGDILYSTPDDPNETPQVYLDQDAIDRIQAEGISLEDFLAELAEEYEPAEVGKSGSAAVTGGPSTVWQTGRKKGSKKLGLADGKFGKSFGASILEDLSKALDDGDRDQVISKVAERVSKAEHAAQVAVAKAERLEAEAEHRAFTEVAKSYELPVDDEELGLVLQKISKVLDEDELDLMDRVLTTAGVGVSTMEIGSSAGYAPSDVMDVVKAHASEIVGKAAGDMTAEMASTAIFSANPAAYDDYLSENR